MNNIPLFDSLTHPTIDSNWLLPKNPKLSNIDVMLAQMERNNISKSLAVGLKGIGSYDEKKYIKLITPFQERIIPVAFFDLNRKISRIEVSEKLKKLKLLGYTGIKLHPRISRFNLHHPLLIPVIKKANELHLNVLLCTYFYGNFSDATKNNIEELSNLISTLNGARLILMHGAAVRLLETIEIVRHNENVLLDLSFTLCKYKGSSLDLDIQFAFDTFDKRICVGSDFPEYTLDELRLRFDYFSKNLSKEKAENIAFNNLNNFLKF